MLANHYLAVSASSVPSKTVLYRNFLINVIVFNVFLAYFTSSIVISATGILFGKKPIDGKSHECRNALMSSSTAGLNLVLIQILKQVQQNFKLGMSVILSLGWYVVLWGTPTCVDFHSVIGAGVGSFKWISLHILLLRVCAFLTVCAAWAPVTDTQIKS